MTLVPTKKKDPTTGLAMQERIFDFEAYNNLLALKFMQIDEEMKDKVSRVEYDKLLAEVKELKKQLMAQEVKPLIL